MERAITVLTAFRKEIGDCNPFDLQDSERANVDRWWRIQESVAAHPAAGDVGWALANGRVGFNRQEIIDLPRTEQGEQLDRRTLIATLMWGYGTQVGRYSNPANIAALLAREDLAVMLSDCRGHLRADEIEAAYTDLSDIRGIRSAYFTKILYFFGKQLELEEYPLILDSMVARGLGNLTGLGLVLSSGYQPNDHAPSYVRFVGLMHRLAGAIDVPTDHLEFFLWDRASPSRPGYERFEQACLEEYKDWIPI